MFCSQSLLHGPATSTFLSVVPLDLRVGKAPRSSRPWTPQQPVLVPRAPLANLRVASDHTACSGTLGHCRLLPTGPHPYSGNHDNGPNSEPQNPHSRPPTTGRDPGFVNPPLHPKPGALRGSGA